jgi:hypothetical protein
MHRPRLLLREGAVALLALVLLATSVLAGDGDFGDYDVPPESWLRLRGLLDVRVGRPGRATAWTDRGPGKTRFGGVLVGTSYRHVTDVDLAQAALEVAADLPAGLVARAQLNLETAADIEWRPLLVDATLRREWGGATRGFGVQAGVMNIPFSLEHAGPAWTPVYTLTPSTIGTWTWEEGRITGGEAEAWQTGPEGVRLDVLGGFGFGADQAGILLAQRGWVLSDYITGVNASLPLPTPGASTSVFDERDLRPAVYFMLTASDPWKVGSLRLGFFDNLGDTSVAGVWRTRFGTVGLELHPVAHLDVLGEFLAGETERAGLADDSRFRAVYFVYSFYFGAHRISARFDDFRVSDLDGPPDTQEHGDAVTLAYLFELGLHQRFAFEYILLDSHHPALFEGDPPDNGWQLSYRYRF